MSYIIKYTDPLKTSFNVQPYTTNGRVNPTLTPLDPSAVTSDSSLLIFGKGMPDYGQNIQNNLLHIVENFASPASAPPLDQTEGQLWYNNTALELKIWEPAGPTPTTWSSILLDTGTAPMRANFDLNNNRLLNVPTVPVAATDAVNEQYVLNHEADADLHLTSEQNLLFDEIELIYAASANLIDLADQVMALEDFDITASRTVETALALKADKIVPGVVNNIALLDASGNLVDGGSQLSDFGATVHTHPATDIVFAISGDIVATNVQDAIEEVDFEMHAADALLAPLVSPTFTGTVQLGTSASLLLDHGPTAPLEAATQQYVTDSVAAIVFAASGISRKVVTSGGSNIFYPPLYTVGSNSLQVYVNGQKYYANVRGLQEVYITDSELIGATGLANDATIYTAAITVDGGASQPVSIVGSAAQTISSLIAEILADVSGLSVTLPSAGTLTFESYNNTGIGTSSIAIVDTNLFSSLDPLSFAITGVNTGTNTVTVDGNKIHRLTIGTSFDIIGSTGNNGTYLVTTIAYIASTDESVITVASIIDATVDGTVEILSEIVTAIPGSLQGYSEQGTVDAKSGTIQFQAPVPTAGQVIEFLVSN